MTNWIIDILPISLLVLFLTGVRFVRPRSAFNTEGYLSLETGNTFRGLFSIMIVQHHLSLYTQSGTVFRCFAVVGYLIVAFYFFLSGYGLQKSYMTKQDDYRRGFLLRRLPTVLIPLLVISFFYGLMHYLFNGQLYSLKDFLLSILDGHPITAYSWYMINMLLFYVAYWVLMCVCKKNYLRMLLGGTIWYILYVLTCVWIGYGTWWYNVSMFPVIGMFWAIYEEKILAVLKKCYAVVAPILWIVLTLLFALSGSITSGGGVPDTPIPVIVGAMLTGLLFVISSLLFSLKVRFGNRVLRFFGSISLEIYISHGLFMKALRSNRLYIENELLWCIAVLAGTILFAYPLHSLLRWILGKYRLLRKT